MSGLFLLIPDVALRESVAEQIKAAKLGEARVVDSVAAWQKQSENANEPPDILIVDDGERRTPSIVDGLTNAEAKPVVLLLGGAEDAEGVTETFAKPFRLGHLITRLRYYLETAPLLRNSVISFGPYKLEPQNRRLITDTTAEPIRLTEKETALLVFLAQQNQPSTRQEILASVWGYDERIDTHTLETHIYQLRRKLEAGGENWLVSEAGAYRLVRGASA